MASVQGQGQPTAEAMVADLSNRLKQLEDAQIPTGTSRRGDVPIGGIIPYYGDLFKIPQNYRLCDGTQGTPNLLDKFTIWAGSTYALGDTGGAATASVSAHTNNHTGTAVATHSSAGTHQHNSQGGHFHNAIGNHTHDDGNFVTVDAAHDAGAADVFAWDAAASSTAAGSHQHSSDGSHTHDNIGGHTHDAHNVTQPTAHDDHSAVATLPPYFGLYPIMRIA